MARPFSTAFLAGVAEAEPFLAGEFRSPAGRRAAVERASARAAHPGLLQLGGFDALSRPGTVAVVTGQQVGLFLGPLYSVYKAATAVVCARSLEQETGVRAVPVFWLQTEDHDFDEVDHCWALDRERGPVKLKLEEAPVARCSVKHAVLGPSVERALQKLETCVGDTEALRLLRTCYRPGVSIAEAFAAGMRALFEGHGLLLVDPRQPQLAHVAAEVHRKAILEAEALAAGLLSRASALEAAGFAVQVPIRGGAPLSFFHPEGAEGPRYRLMPQGDGFVLAGRGESDENPTNPGAWLIARSELLQALERTPERFSTSALLRPMLQDTLLPTAAIVGGPGELNYFAQLAPLYRAFGLPQPMAVPRARFRHLTPRTRSLLAELSLRPEDVEVPEEQLLARLRPPGAISPEALEQQLIVANEQVLATLAEPRTQGVIDGVQRTRATVARAANRLARRVRHALDTADSVRVERVRRLQHALFPNGTPQERVYGLAQLAGSRQIAEVSSGLLAAVEPWSTDVKELA